MKNIFFKLGVLIFIVSAVLFSTHTNYAEAAITLADSERLLIAADNSWDSLDNAGRSVKIDVYQKAVNAGMTHAQSLGEANYIYNRIPNVHSGGTSGREFSSVQGSGWTYNESGEITLNTMAVFQPAVPEGNRTFNNTYSQIINPDWDRALGSNNNGDDLMVPSHASTGVTANALNTSPTTTCAQEGLEGVDFLVFHGPLVPCGINKQCANSGDRENDISVPCTLCHFIILVKNVFDLLLSLIITASLFMLTVAGVMYIVSSGGQLTGMAKGIIEKTLLGFGIFLLSWLLVYTLLNMLSVRDTVVGKGSRATWFQFECDTKSSFYMPTQQHSDDTTQQHSDDTTTEDTTTQPPASGDRSEQDLRTQATSAGATMSPASCEGTSSGNVGGCVSYVGATESTMEGIGDLASGCHSANPNCVVQTNSVTDRIINPTTGETYYNEVHSGDANCTYCHHSGDKVDYQANPELNSYLTGFSTRDEINNIAVGEGRGTLVRIGTRNSPPSGPKFRDGDNNVWIYEAGNGPSGGHWDVCYAGSACPEHRSGS